MGQINDKFKKLIFDKLYRDLSHVEIILHDNNSIWFIDRKEKYWYLELEKDGRLWWRWTFFSNFFHLFSMELSDFEPIISEWVEEVLNSKVVSTRAFLSLDSFLVEEVLNSKVVSTDGSARPKDMRVEEVLNSKVVSTSTSAFFLSLRVEEVLNSKVVSTIPTNGPEGSEVEDALNSKFVLTPVSATKSPFMVEEVLNRNITC